MCTDDPVMPCKLNGITKSTAESCETDNLTHRFTKKNEWTLAFSESK